MRLICGLLALAFLSAACDSQRVFEENTDFPDRYWRVDDQPAFDFEITDTAATYNLYGNVRNSLEYPFSRIFVNYSLVDSTGKSLSRKMVSEFLFHEKTGAPFGESGLGDIYYHRIPLETNFRFPAPGVYTATFEQYMRRDTLEGVLAVGLRVERAMNGQ